MRQRRFLFGVVLLLALVLLGGCSSTDPSKLIVGKWQMNDTRAEFFHDGTANWNTLAADWSIESSQDQPVLVIAIPGTEPIPHYIKFSSRDSFELVGVGQFRRLK